MTKKSISTLAVLLLLCTPAFPKGECEAGRRAPLTLAYRLPPRSEITVRYSASGFGGEQRRAIRQAVEEWDRSLQSTSLNIRLADGGTFGAEPDCDRCLTIVRDPDLPTAKYGRIRALKQSGGYITAARVGVHPDAKKASDVRLVVQHEIGHALGLADCDGCPAGATVMSHLRSVSFNGIPLPRLFSRPADRPTGCDLAAVALGYERQPPAAAPLEAQLDRHSPQTDDRAPESASARDTDTTAPETGVGMNLPRVAVGATPEWLAGVLRAEQEAASALAGYTFTRSVLIETLDKEGRVTGEYRRLSQIILDDAGRRVERVIAFPKPTLKRLVITREDLEDLSGVQMIGVEHSKINLHDFEEVGVEMRDGKLYRAVRVVPNDLGLAKRLRERVFYGMALVDMGTNGVALMRGVALPEGNQRFPRFTTERRLVDGKYLFPHLTTAEDTLVFPRVAVRMRMRVEYYDYKRYRVESRVEEGEVFDEGAAAKSHVGEAAPDAVKPRTPLNR